MLHSIARTKIKTNNLQKKKKKTLKLLFRSFQVKHTTKRNGNLETEKNETKINIKIKYSCTQTVHTDIQAFVGPAKVELYAI